MPEPQTPWTRPAPSRWRFAVWFSLLAAVGLGCWLLSRAFPEGSRSDYDQAQIVYAFALLALVSSSIVLSRRFSLGESLRNIAIWAGIAAVLVVGYLYRGAFSDIGTRLQAEFLPAEPVATGPHEIALTESEGGSYAAVGAVNGVRVKFVIDTGASDIVLSPADAERAGIDMTALNYNGETETANGAGRGAATTVSSLAIGPLHFSNVDISVNQAPMGASLLGLAFLRRLKSFEFKDHRLYLRW
jgi:aspartyl protease family protein